MFDQIYVLARGGVCIYSGSPPNKPTSNQKITNLFSISTIISFPTLTATGTATIEQLIKYSCEDYYHSEIVRTLVNQNNNNNRQFQLNSTTRSEIISNRRRFQCRSVAILIERYLTRLIYGQYWKDYILYLTIYFMMSLCLTQVFSPNIAQPSGCISIEDDFSRQSSSSSTCDISSGTTTNQRSLENVAQFDILIDNHKYTFFMGNMFLFVVVMHTSMTFSQDLIHFRCEHSNGWYSTGVFYLMKRLHELPLLLPLVMIHVHICNYYDHIRPGIYWNFILVRLLASFATQPLSHICAIISAYNKNNNTITLTMTTITVMVISTLLSNLFIHIDKLSNVHQFVANFSVLRFNFEALTLLQYGFGRCGQREIQPILYMMAINDGDYYRALIMLTFLALMYHILAIILLIRSVNPIEDRRKRIVEPGQ